MLSSYRYPTVALLPLLIIYSLEADLSVEVMFWYYSYYNLLDITFIHSVSHCYFSYIYGQYIYFFTEVSISFLSSMIPSI